MSVGRGHDHTRTPAVVDNLRPVGLENVCQEVAHPLRIRRTQSPARRPFATVDLPADLRPHGLGTQTP
jgi:hypothetical protein